MKTIIQKPWEVFGVALMSFIISVPLFAVVVPDNADKGSRRTAAVGSEDVKKTEVKLREIISEISSEQERHQKKIQSIEKELRQTESTLKQEEQKEKHWVSPKVAMVLGENQS